MITHRANPFDSEMARAHSSYAAYRDKNLVLLLEEGKPASELSKFVHGQVRSMILETRYSCVGAKAAMNQGTYRFGLYPRMASPEATAGLCRDLFAFVEEQANMQGNFTTFIACFSEPIATDEAQFEDLLWAQLQSLHDNDLCEWDPTVSFDPSDPRFSFSFAGRAFFIVGLHAGSSRWARRFAWPTLVFNAHDQFERLRELGEYEGMKRVIRARDAQLQGSPNPALSNFGEITEARQYSGRAAEEGWECPLIVRDDGGGMR